MPADLDWLEELSEWVFAIFFFFFFENYWAVKSKWQCVLYSKPRCLFRSDIVIQSNKVQFLFFISASVESLLHHILPYMKDSL